jgi:hypothetical protein
MLEDAGEKIGDHRELLEGMLGETKFADMGPRGSAAADEFATARAERFPELKTEIHVGNNEHAEKLERMIRSAGHEPSFEALQNIQKAIKSEGKAYISKSVQARLSELANNIVAKHLDDAAQRMYENGALKEKFADYLAQKERYEAAKVLTEGVNEFKGTGRMPHGFGLLDMVRFGMHASYGNPIGGVLHVAGHHVLKSFMANKWGLLGKGVSFLRGIAEDPATAPFIGGFIAKEGADALTSHVDSLPSILTHAKKVAAHTASDVISDIIGSTSGLTKQQQYDRLTDTINQAAVDPSVTADRVGRVASTFSGTNVQLASAVAEKQFLKIQYLQSQIPKDPNPPRPFQKNEWNASPQQQRDFLEKVVVASNPMAVWQHYQEGKLTSADRDALMATSPRIYQEMVVKLQAAAHDPKGPKLSREQIAQVDMFTGGALGTTRNLKAIQDALTAGQQQQQAQAAQPRPSSRPKLRTPGVQTDTQRRTAGVPVHLAA